MPSSTPREGERHAFRRLILCLDAIGKQTSGRRDTVDLPLALVGIALLSAEETHCFLVVDVLRTIDDFHDFLQGANSVLAKRRTCRTVSSRLLSSGSQSHQTSIRTL